MPNYGAILENSPSPVGQGERLTLTIPANSQLRFLPGQTYVDFKILGGLGRVTIIPAGVSHAGDREISFDVPALGPGAYETGISSGFDRATTRLSIMVTRAVSAAAAPRNYGAILHPPSPAVAAQGQAVTLRAPQNSQFIFIQGSTYVTLRGSATAQITIIPSGITHQGTKTISFAVPQMPAGTNRVIVSSRGSSAEATAALSVQAAGTGTPPRTRPSGPILPGHTAVNTPPFNVASLPISPPPQPRTTLLPQMATPATAPGVLGARAGLTSVVFRPQPQKISLFRRSIASILSVFRRVFLSSSSSPSGGGSPAGSPASSPSGSGSPAGSPASSPSGSGSPAGSPSGSPTPAPGGGTTTTGLPTSPRVVIPGPTLPSGPIPAAPPNYEFGHQVHILADGANFFGTADQLFQNVIDAPDGIGYVHFMFWGADKTMRLGPLAGDRKIIDAIDAAGRKNKEVRALIWDPSPAATTFGPSWITRLNSGNEGFADAVNNLGHATVEAVAEGMPIGPFRSYHEKMMIFFDGEVVTILVGGLNLFNRYVDTTAHARTGSKPWHDVGVMIRGTETVTAEAYFNARWQKVGSTAVAGPTPVNMSFGTESVRLRHQDPIGQVPQIREELFARIRAATSYVYLENYSIHEAGLIELLAKRIEEDNLNVIILTNRPINSSVYGWLHFVTQCQLSFARCTAFTYTDATGIARTVTKPANPAIWEFSRNGDWYEDTTVRWPGGSIKISEITGFTGGVPFYRLIQKSGTSEKLIYVHSKVAIFDGTSAMVGSANFNQRSLADFNWTYNSDGEYSAFFSGASASTLQSTLWGEYFPGGAPPAGGWATAAAGHVATGGMSAGGVYAVPVTWREYRRRPISRTESAWHY